MAGWHHRLDGHEFEWTPGVGDGQGGLACCNSWACKELDMTEWLNWTELSVQFMQILSWAQILSLMWVMIFLQHNPETTQQLEHRPAFVLIPVPQDSSSHWEVGEPTPFQEQVKDLIMTPFHWGTRKHRQQVVQLAPLPWTLQTEFPSYQSAGFLFFMQTIFKVFIKFVAILFLLFIFWLIGWEACAILVPWTGIEPTPPTLEGEVSTTGPPGKSPKHS